MNLWLWRLWFGILVGLNHSFGGCWKLPFYVLFYKPRKSNTRARNVDMTSTSHLFVMLNCFHILCIKFPVNICFSRWECLLFEAIFMLAVGLTYFITWLISITSLIEVVLVTMLLTKEELAESVDQALSVIYILFIVIIISSSVISFRTRCYKTC